MKRRVSSDPCDQAVKFLVLQNVGNVLTSLVTHPARHNPVNPSGVCMARSNMQTICIVSCSVNVLFMILTISTSHFTEHLYLVLTTGGSDCVFCAVRAEPSYEVWMTASPREVQ